MHNESHAEVCDSKRLKKKAAEQEKNSFFANNAMRLLFSLVILLIAAFAAISPIAADKNLIVEHSFDAGKSWQERGHFVRKSHSQLLFRPLTTDASATAAASWTK